MENSNILQFADKSKIEVQKKSSGINLIKSIIAIFLLSCILSISACFFDGGYGWRGGGWRGGGWSGGGHSERLSGGGGHGGHEGHGGGHR